MKKTLLLIFASLFVVASVFAVTASKDAVYQAIEKYEAGYSLSAVETQMLVEAGYTFGEMPVIDQSGGPDGFGYVWKDNLEPDGPTYSWVDISGTGTDIAPNLSDDDQDGPYPIGFTFNYYGVDYTQFYVHSNGVISFTSIATAPYTNATLPGTFAGPVVCWFWDDFDVNSGVDGSVYYETVTVGAQLALVVSYVNCAHYSGPASGIMTGQVLFFEDGTILTQYDAFDANWPVDSATIGLRNGDGSIYLQADFDSLIPNYPTAGTAMEFSILPGDADLAGTVTDAVTGDPIPGVNVSIWIQNGTTDGSGFYSFTGLYSGDNDITLSMAGYNTHSETIVLDPGTNSYDFELMPQYMLDIEPLAGTTVPAGGGVVYYAAQLENPTPFASMMNGWTWAVMPDLNVFGPIVQANLNVQPGTTTVPQLALQVPAAAPNNLIAYHAAIGVFPNLIYSEDLFYFWKVGPPGPGAAEWSGTQWDDAIAGLADEIVIPDRFDVAKVYPNPFNPTATIAVTLPEASDISVRIYNVTGQLVAELANGYMQGGTHNLVIDGSALASGVYFVHTQVPGQVNNMQKITLLK